MAESPEQRTARHALDKPLIDAFNELSASTLARAEAEEDPLAGVPDIFTGPDTDEEAKRRRHAGMFALTALDRRESRQARENAVRHLLVCDPVRGLGVMIELCANAFAAMESVLPLPPGGSLDMIRKLDGLAHEQGD